MEPLTYGERTQLLEEIESLSLSGVDDEELLARSSRALRAHDSPFGLVENLARNVTAISGWLREYPDGNAAGVARGALAYVLELIDSGIPTPADRLSLLSAVYATTLALGELDESYGASRGYMPWRLSEQDRRRAEDVFLECYAQGDHSVKELLEQSARVQDRHAFLQGAGFFGRFLRNIDYLGQVLQDPNSTSEQHAWARGALEYLVKKEDAIDDRLGLIGLLDDAFILNTASQFVGPERQPWQELLDRLFQEWPFLSGVLLHGEGMGGMPSEYLLANAALACPELRRGNGHEVANVATVLPCVDPLPLVIGLLATLARVQEHITSGDAHVSYTEGETVIVDNEAYAEFGGFEHTRGEKGFVLRWWPRNQEPVRQFLPIQQLSRVRSAAARDRPSGPVMPRREGTGATVSALEYLLQLDYPAVLRDVGTSTIVVTYATTARQQSSRIRISGHPLADVLPIGHLRTDGEWEMWSPEFGGEQPLLAVVPDLDDAASILAESDAPQLAVVNLSGANAGRRHALQRLTPLRVPVIALAAESEERAINALHDEGFAFWNWTPVEIEQLVWPPARRDSTADALVRHERRVRESARVKPVVRTIALPAADSAYDALQKLRSLVRRRRDSGGNPPALDAAQGHIRAAFFTTLQSLGQDVTGDVESRLHSAERIVTERSTFLTPDEREILGDIIGHIREMLAGCQCGQLKVESLQELLRDSPQLNVAIRRREDIERLRDELHTEGFVTVLDDVGDEWVSDGLVVPGWFGRKRMARLLTPPLAEPMILILYDLERRWFDLLEQKWRYDRERRSEQGRKEAVFPAVSGWREGDGVPRSTEDGAPHEEIQEKIRELEWHELRARRESALRRSVADETDSTCEATLVWFTDDRFAFLTPERKVACVTHLLAGGAVEQSGAEVRQVTVAELKPGEAILLSSSADRDLLRTVADEMLPQGTRELATLWQRALRAFVEREGLEPRTLRQRLAAAGCRRHIVTLRGWLEDDEIIAPRDALTGDLQSIVAVTGDTRLEDALEKCKTAISGVWSAHLRAARLLADRVLARVSRRLGEGMGLQEIEALEDDVVLLQIDEIDEEPVKVNRSQTNRLLEIEG